MLNGDFMKDVKTIEKSIIKKFRKTIWSKFTKAIVKYEMIKENDKIAVCISGGKDSVLMAKCFQELHKYSSVKFDIVYLVMNPGYSEQNLTIIKNNCQLLEIPITIFDTKIYDIVFNINEGSPCYLCARMRRGNLYNKAQELGCNKIALGHHFNDVIETSLLSMLYSGEIKTMLPKVKSKNFKNMELIRPMYFIKENDIISFKNYNELQFINCACRFTESCSINDSSDSKRLMVKNLIKQLNEDNEYVAHNIFKSMSNVNLSGVLEYKKNDIKHEFLDRYNEGDL